MSRVSNTYTNRLFGLIDFFSREPRMAVQLDEPVTWR
jgi:hypothetical protein